MSEDYEVIKLVNDASRSRRCVQRNRRILKNISEEEKQRRKHELRAEMLRLAVEILACVLIAVLAVVAMFAQCFSAVFANTLVAGCIIYAAIRIDRRFGREQL